MSDEAGEARLKAFLEREIAAISVAIDNHNVAKVPPPPGEVVLSYWKDISHGLKPRKNLRGDPRRITKTRKICGTAVSKLHGRAPNPRARQRGGRAPVEVGDFPFLESIFMIFGKLSGLFPDNRPLRAISRRNDQRLPKSAPKILTNHRNDSKTTCRQPPRARGPPPAESGVLARPRSLGWYSNH